MCDPTAAPRNVEGFKPWGRRRPCNWSYNTHSWINLPHHIGKTGYRHGKNDCSGNQLNKINCTLLSRLHNTAKTPHSHSYCCPPWKYCTIKSYRELHILFCMFSNQAHCRSATLPLQACTIHTKMQCTTILWMSFFTFIYLRVANLM